jgi:hypothetical protein
MFQCRSFVIDVDQYNADGHPLAGSYKWQLDGFRHLFQLFVHVVASSSTTVLVGVEFRLFPVLRPFDADGVMGLGLAKRPSVLHALVTNHWSLPRGWGWVTRPPEERWDSRRNPPFCSDPDGEGHGARKVKRRKEEAGRTECRGTGCGTRNAACGGREAGRQSRQRSAAGIAFLSNNGMPTLRMCAATSESVLS